METVNSMKKFIASLVRRSGMEFEEPDLDNGLILNSHYVPEEVLTHLLSFVDPRTLVLQCRRVCRRWRDTITNTEVWKLKMSRSNAHPLSKYNRIERKKLTQGYPWYLFYWILNDVPFERNLLLNNCGQEQLNHWTVIEPEKMLPLGNAFWDVEAQPLFAESLPKSEEFEDNQCCFSTSFVRCRKMQMIDLRARRFPVKLLDEFQPTITISEWYAGRYDCACEYTLFIRLLDTRLRDLVRVHPIEKHRIQWEGQEWNKVTCLIRNYGPGLRYIKFEHYGKDRQFWQGNYGSKMAGGVVKLSLPEIRNSEGSAGEPLIFILQY